MIQISSWVVSFCGWLLIPLLIGSLMSRSYNVKTMELKLELSITNYGMELGLRGEELKAYVKAKMEYARRLTR